MNRYELKEIFTGEVQRITNGNVFMHHLNDHLDCILKTENSSYLIKFIYNDSYKKEWNFCSRDFIGIRVNEKVICIFVANDDKYLYSYHIINAIELLNIYSLTPRDFLFSEETYYFEDIDDSCKDKWNIFK